MRCSPPDLSVNDQSGVLQFLTSQQLICSAAVSSGCWESRLTLDQNPQVLVNDRIARDKDPQEATSPCHKHTGSVGLSNVQPSSPNASRVCIELVTYALIPLVVNHDCRQTKTRRCQSTIASLEDPREVVIPCHETHGECWFIQCPTISPPTRAGCVSNS